MSTIEASNVVTIMKQALGNYMSAFGQGLEAHGIPYGPQQIEADAAARQALDIASKLEETAVSEQHKPHKWVGLTDADWKYLEENCGSTRSAIKTAESLLKEKNTNE